MQMNKNSVPRLLFPPLTGAETTMLAPDNIIIYNVNTERMSGYIGYSLSHV